MKHSRGYSKLLEAFLNYSRLLETILGHQFNGTFYSKPFQATLGYSRLP